jgi:uncharacterized membrane protein (TIGR02234 family)
VTTGARRAVVLLLAGSGLVLLSTTGDWVTGLQPRPEPLPEQQVSASAGPVRALGLLALAGAPALLATRGRGRLALGLLLLGAAAVTAILAVDALTSPAGELPAGSSDVAATWRPLLALAGAVLTGVSAAVVVRRGRGWAGLSRRYDGPTAPSAGAATPSSEPADGGPALWDALDRGEDPTRR